MRLADGIRKHGFRKWYEGELMRSHAHLALTFLCAIGVYAGLDGLLQYRTIGDQLGDLATLILCGCAGAWSLRRYLFLLMHAEATAHQADCPQCKAYGRFKVESESAREGSVTVCCNKCQRLWQIHE